MPQRRAKHCTQVINEEIVLILGGTTPSQSAPIAHFYNITSNKWSPVGGDFPCGAIPTSTFTTCGIVKKRWDDYDVVIPSINSRRQPCTAILKWPSLEWKVTRFDSRQYPVGGQVLT